MHGLARGAADRALRHPHGRDAGRRHHAVGSHDRRSAEAARLRDRAVRQVAPRRRPARGQREPTHQGFDEYYGIPRTSNEAQTTTSRTGSTSDAGHAVHLGRQGRRAVAQREAVRPGHAPHGRPRSGRARRRVHGAQRRRRSKPFFLYYPMTQIHFPTLAHPDFAGKTGAGDIGDAMADVDHNVGLVLDAIDRLGDRAQHDRALVHRQRRRSAAAVARIVRTVERLLQHGDGRRHPHAVHHPLAGPHSRRPGVERDRPPGRSLPDVRRRRRRRHRPEGSRHRRREPAAVPRGQAGEVEPRQRDLLHEHAARAR